MAVGKLEYKKCTKCSRQFPATTEYFYFNKSRNKLHSWCKTCKDEYSKERMRLWRQKQKNQQCKTCKDEYSKEHMRLWRQKQKNQHELAKLISTSIKQRNIDALKEKYTKGMGIEIRQGDKKLYGRVIKHFKHFMTVQTRHYKTSILYKDILIGAVKIK